MFYSFISILSGLCFWLWTDETWRKRRKQLNPAFSHQVLQQYLNCFNKIADKTIRELKIMSTNDSKDGLFCLSYYDLEDLISRSILELSCCKYKKIKITTTTITIILI